MSEPQVIAIAGAKGGTGKSVIAANIGVFLATLDKTVVLVDCAFGSGTLHSFVGVTEPSRGLADFFAEKDTHLSEVLSDTKIRRLQLVSGQCDPAWASNPRSHQLQRLKEQIRELPVDYVVLDLSPGTRENILDLFLDADTSIVVSSAEPTAVEMSYRLIKAAFVRSLRRSELGFLTKVGTEEVRSFEGGIPAPSDFLARAIARYDEESEEVAKLREHMASLVPHLVLNFARSKGDMDLGRDISAAATRRFGVTIPYLGWVEYDDAVWVSLRRRRPLLIEHPESRASKCMEKLTRKVIGLSALKTPVAMILGDSHYDLLDVEPTASEEQIRRANRRIRQVYSENSVVVGGLYGRGRLETLHRRLQDAYETLMDPRRRRANDLTLFPDGIPTTVPTQPIRLDLGTVPNNLPKPPVLEDDSEYSGQLLQQVREARGLDLREIADRTKIGMTYLHALEREAVTELPAMVYVRGFVVGYAKALDLNVARVLETYMPRLQAAISDSGMK